MGYLRHECIIVSGEIAVEVLQAHGAALSIFNQRGCGSLVGGLSQHITNGGAAFLISPDGSKEGWYCSDIAAAARAEFILYLRSGPSFNWAHVLIGGDDGEYEILQSPAKSLEAAS